MVKDDTGKVGRWQNMYYINTVWVSMKLSEGSAIT